MQYWQSSIQLNNNRENCMDWLPTLSEWQGPVFLRIVEALAADIASGRLARGQQIPTHRALAKALDIDLTTVTRAYGEARRRGLLEAQIGRGTFVSETTARTAEKPPTAGPQVPERNFLRGKAEWTSSLAVVAAAVESGGISVPYAPSASGGSW
jgi:DNA-binding transcriptional regulator YhcF (GntR family)